MTGWFLLSAVQGMTLEQMEARFTEEMGKIESSRLQQEQELKRNYLAALLRFESTARREGDLDGVQAVRKEISRVETSRELTPASLSRPEELRKMGEVVNQQLAAFKRDSHTRIAEMVTSVERYAEGQAVTLTRSGSIQEAVAWRDWGRGLRERPQVSQAVTIRTSVREGNTAGTVREDAKPVLFRQPPATLITKKATEFPGTPTLYAAGSEPDGDEKRITTHTPSAQGAGNALLHARIRLIDESITLANIDRIGYDYKHKRFLYAGRLELSPLPGRSLETSLVVFDLFKRGSGSKREIIRTEGLVMPPLGSGERWVVDSGSYTYETREYDSRYAGWDSEYSTADEFYGFIVSIFDQEGNLVLQRTSERILGEFARTEAPDSFDRP